MSSERVHDHRQVPAQRLRRGSQWREVEQQLDAREQRLLQQLRAVRDDDARLQALLRGLPYAERWLARIVAIRELGAGRARTAFARVGIDTPLPLPAEARVAELTRATHLRNVIAGLARSGALTAEILQALVGSAQAGVRSATMELLEAAPHTAKPARKDAPAREPAPAKRSLLDELRSSFGDDVLDVPMERDSELPRGAEAVTRGGRVYFARGQYDRRSTEGRVRIGHEVAHVIQQRRGRSAPIQKPAARSALEAEAERAGQAFARGQRYEVQGVAPFEASLYRGEPGPQQAQYREQFKLVMTSKLEGEPAPGTKLRFELQELFQSIGGPERNCNWKVLNAQGKEVRGAGEKQSHAWGIYEAKFPEPGTFTVVAEVYKSEIDEDLMRASAGSEFGAVNIPEKQTVLETHKIQQVIKDPHAELTTALRTATTESVDQVHADAVRQQQGLGPAQTPTARPATPAAATTPAAKKPVVAHLAISTHTPKTVTLGDSPLEPALFNVRLLDAPKDAPAPHYRWFAIPAHPETMVGVTYEGVPRTTIPKGFGTHAGQEAFDLGDKATARWPIVDPNLYTIVCYQVDATGRAARANGSLVTASTTLAVQTADEAAERALASDKIIASVKGNVMLGDKAVQRDYHVEQHPGSTRKHAWLMSCDNWTAVNAKRYPHATFVKALPASFHDLAGKHVIDLGATESAAWNYGDPGKYTIYCLPLDEKGAPLVDVRGKLVCSTLVVQVLSEKAIKAAEAQKASAIEKANLALARFEIKGGGPNPAKSTWDGSNHYWYSALPDAKPPAPGQPAPPHVASFHWYALGGDLSKMALDYYGAKQVKMPADFGGFAGKPAFDLGVGWGAEFSMSTPGDFRIFGVALDPEGKPFERDGELFQYAWYDQRILNSDDYNTYQQQEKAKQKQAADQVQYVKDMESTISKIQKGKAEPIKCVYKNTETGKVLDLFMYVGPAVSGGMLLLDYTAPSGQTRREYRGSDIADALDAFKHGNSYPTGLVRFEVPASMGGKEVEIATKGESTWAKWSSTAGLISLGGMVLGTALTFTGVGAVVGVPLLTASAVLGAGAASLSLYDHLHETDISKTKVAVDVGMIAASLIGLGSMRAASMAAQGIARAAQVAKGLQSVALVLDAGNIVLVSPDSVPQIDLILSSNMTGAEKTRALVLILGNLAMNLGMAVYGHREALGLSSAPHGHLGLPAPHPEGVSARQIDAPVIDMVQGADGVWAPRQDPPGTVHGAPQSSGRSAGAEEMHLGSDGVWHVAGDGAEARSGTGQTTALATRPTPVATPTVEAPTTIVETHEPLLLGPGEPEATAVRPEPADAAPVRAEAGPIETPAAPAAAATEGVAPRAPLAELPTREVPPGAKQYAEADDGRQIYLLEGEYEFVDENGRRCDDAGDLINEHGQLIDKYGRRVDHRGRFLNEDGELIDAQGRRVDDKGNLIDKQLRRINEHGELVDSEGRPLSEAPTGGRVVAERDLSEGSGAVGEVFLTHDADGTAFVVKCDRADLPLDNDVARVVALEKYGGPKFLGMKQIRDLQGRWRTGMAMELVQGKDISKLADALAAGQALPFAISDAHIEAFETLLARLKSDGFALGEVNPGDFILTPDGRVVPLDMDLDKGGDASLSERILQRLKALKAQQDRSSPAPAQPAVPAVVHHAEALSTAVQQFQSEAIGEHVLHFSDPASLVSVYEEAGFVDVYPTTEGGLHVRKPDATASHLATPDATHGETREPAVEEGGVHASAHQEAYEVRPKDGLYRVDAQGAHYVDQSVAAHEPLAPGEVLVATSSDFQLHVIRSGSPEDMAQDAEQYRARIETAVRERVATALASDRPSGSSLHADWIRGRIGPGVHDEHLLAARRLANELGEPIVMWGSRQSGLSAKTGAPFDPKTDLDIGAVGEPDALFKLVAADWQSIPDATDGPNVLYSTPEEAVAAGAVVVLPDSQLPDAAPAPEVAPERAETPSTRTTTTEQVRAVENPHDPIAHQAPEGSAFVRVFVDSDPVAGPMFMSASGHVDDTSIVTGMADAIQQNAHGVQGVLEFRTVPPAVYAHPVPAPELGPSFVRLSGGTIAERIPLGEGHDIFRVHTATSDVMIGDVVSDFVADSMKPIQVGDRSHASASDPHRALSAGELEQKRRVDLAVQTVTSKVKIAEVLGSRTSDYRTGTVDVQVRDEFGRHLDIRLSEQCDQILTVVDRDTGSVIPVEDLGKAPPGRVTHETVPEPIAAVEDVYVAITDDPSLATHSTESQSATHVTTAPPETTTRETTAPPETTTTPETATHETTTPPEAATTETAAEGRPEGPRPLSEQPLVVRIREGLRRRIASVRRWFAAGSAPARPAGPDRTGAAPEHAYIAEAMDRINSSKKGEGVHYSFNAEKMPWYKPEMSDGYADPKYWQRVGDMSWELRSGVSASEGIKAWLKGPTVAECNSAMVAIETDAVRAALGDKEFDARYGAEGQEVSKAKRLKIMQGYGDAWSDFGGETKAARMGDLGPPGHRNVEVGEWYYYHNHSKYYFKHPAGFWRGENAIYAGTVNGKQVWSGMGVTPVTEEEMMHTMIATYNAPRTAADLAFIENLRKSRFGKVPKEFDETNFPDKITTEDFLNDKPPPAASEDDTQTAPAGLAKRGLALDSGKIEAARTAAPTWTADSELPKAAAPSPDAAVVIESLKSTGELPASYVSREGALTAKGTKYGDAVEKGAKASFKIGGDVFPNSRSVLPMVEGRVWHVADFGPDQLLGGKLTRPKGRICYSSDGLVYTSSNQFDSVQYVGRWKEAVVPASATPTADHLATAPPAVVTEQPAVETAVTTTAEPAVETSHAGEGPIVTEQPATALRLPLDRTLTLEEMRQLTAPNPHRHDLGVVVADFKAGLSPRVRKTTSLIDGNLMAADIEKIRAGQAVQTLDEKGGCPIYEIEGRRYGSHEPRELFPMDGPGIIVLSDKEMIAFGKYAKEGDNGVARAWVRARVQKNIITQADADAALKAFHAIDGGGTAVATAGAARTDALTARSQPFADPDQIPGGAGGVEGSGRYLRTMDIQSSDLGYASEISPDYIAHPELPTDLSQIPVVHLDKVTEVVLASDEHSGSAGHIRIADLNGRPVVLKTYDSAAGEEMLSEARSAKLYSDLGIGAQFHGMFRDDAGRWNIVIDIVPGDFSGTPITSQTFADLETILVRVRAAGLEQLGDMQFYRTQQGRLLLIDPGGAADSLGKPAFSPVEGAGGDFTRQRLSLLWQSPSEVGIAYLEQLRSTNPVAWQGVMEMLAKPSRSSAYQVQHSAPYADYAKRSGFAVT